jgi:dipeptidyl aminopeptidase/acylaminoacyl peptidase
LLGPGVVENSRVDARLGHVRFETAQVFTRPAATILLPRGYDEHPGRRYPLLLLLHGGGADHREDLPRIVAALDPASG